MVKRQNLTVLNNSKFCKGTITRHRITKNKEEKSILDYILVCDILSNYVTSMLIDDQRLFTLTKFVSTKGIIKQTKSDHNVLYCNFDLAYKQELRPQMRQEIFNLKNSECQEVFKYETENTSKFTDIFEKKEPIDMKAAKFRRCLNQSVRKSFKKIRVNKKGIASEIDQQLVQWNKLKIFIKNSECKQVTKIAQTQFIKLDEKIQTTCSKRNVALVEEYVSNLTVGGRFSQTGMWKLKTKLNPK